MKAPRRRVSPYPRRSKSGGRKEGHNRDKQDQVIQTTNGRFVSCVSLCFPCYAQGAEIHEIFGKGKRFSERAHTSLILGLVDTTVYLLLFITISGVYMWAVIKAERKIGLVLLGAGSLSFVLIVSGFF